MARRKKSEEAPAPTPRKDIRPLIYYGLDQLFCIVYTIAIIKVIPNRLPSAAIHLWTIPIFTQIMAVGTATWFVPSLRRYGWWTAVIASSLLLLSTIVLILRVIVSAAFLAGVYGAFGKAAATGALVGVAIVVEIVGLLPAVQLRYLLSRAGRRVYLP